MRAECVAKTVIAEARDVMKLEEAQLTVGFDQQTTELMEQQRHSMHVALCTLTKERAAAHGAHGAYVKANSLLRGEFQQRYAPSQIYGIQGISGIKGI